MKSPVVKIFILILLGVAGYIFAGAGSIERTSTTVTTKIEHEKL